MKTINIILFTLILAGCMSGNWTHSNKSSDQYSSDYRECVSYAWNETENQGINGSNRRFGLTKSCMVEKGKSAGTLVTFVTCD